MNIEPLSKEIYDRAIAAGVAQISLAFSGGNDEGNLSIELSNAEGDEIFDDRLTTDIDTWVWDAYSYSGAGDGSDYGDDITYDLKSMQARHSEWWTSRQDGESDQTPFSIAPEEETAPEEADEYPLTATAEAKIQMIRDELASTNSPERVAALLNELEATLTK